MRLEVNFFNGEHLVDTGSVVLVDGFAVATTPALCRFLTDLGPRLWYGQVVTPEDGELYLRALAGIMTGPYRIGVLVDESAESQHVVP